MKKKKSDAKSARTVRTAQRKQKELEDDAENSKRYKTLIGSVAEEFLCPITKELPLDPVIAEDGNVYERSAIEECIKRQEDDLKSPATNLPMGPRLTPGLRVRSSIRKLVGSDAIGKDVAKRWKKRIKDETKVAAMKKKAEGGDTGAMCDLGDWYSYGRKGLPIDEKRAYQWYKKTSDLKCVRGMAEEGGCLVCGCGVEENISYGATLMGIAAALGSDMGAYYMGEWYMEGENGFPEDNAKAKIWLRKVAGGSCSVNHLWEGDIEDAKNRLGELESGEQ